MKNTLLRIPALLAVLFAINATAFAAAEIGKPAPDFTAQDIQGKPVKLSDYKGKIVVLEWVNPECPFVKDHYASGNIPALQKNAAAEGVIWLSINSAAPGKQGDYAPEKVASWTKSKNAAPAAYLRDHDGSIGKGYGAKTTPHMFVIDTQGTLAYQGAIDSIRSAKSPDRSQGVNYVTAAIASLKSGSSVEKSSTAPYGCPVKY